MRILLNERDIARAIRRHVGAEGPPLSNPVELSYDRARHEFSGRIAPLALRAGAPAAGRPACHLPGGAIVLNEHDIGHAVRDYVHERGAPWARRVQLGYHRAHRRFFAACDG